MKLHFCFRPLPIMNSKRCCSWMVGLLMLWVGSLPLAADALQQALLYYNRGKFAEATQLLEPLRDQGRLEASGCALLAMCYLNTQDVEAARQAVTIASRLDPDDYLVQVAQGNLHLHLGEYRRAEALFQRLQAAFPQRGETRQGCVQAIIGLSLEAVQRGDFDAAADQADRALGLQPNNPQLLSHKISVLRQTERLQELEQAYRRYLELRPAGADAHAGLGVLLNARGEESRAREHFEKAVQYDTTDPKPYLELGTRAAAEGELGRARALVQEAVGKAVHMFNSYRMQAAREMERENTQEAERLQRLQSLSDESMRPKRILEESLSVLTGLYADAEAKALLQDLHRLADWYSSSTDVRTVLAEQLMAAGYTAQAQTEWSVLITQYPYYYRAQLGLAECHRRQGRLTKAALAGRRALDLAPEEPKVYRSLETIYRQMGKPEVYLQVLEMQIMKDKYNILLYEQASGAAAAVGDEPQAELFRERAQMLREYYKTHSSPDE